MGRGPGHAASDMQLKFEGLVRLGATSSTELSVHGDVNVSTVDWMYVNKVHIRSCQNVTWYPRAGSLGRDVVNTILSTEVPAHADLSHYTVTEVVT